MTHGPYPIDFDYYNYLGNYRNNHNCNNSYHLMGTYRVPAILYGLYYLILTIFLEVKWY